MRRPNIIPSSRISLRLPEDLRHRLDAHLRSPSGEIPLGAYQKFFVARIEKFLCPSTPASELANFASELATLTYPIYSERQVFVAGFLSGAHHVQR